jgi:hypothetical protein
MSAAIFWCVGPEAMTATLAPPWPGASGRNVYRTSRPVTARPMIMRWISEVPSKIVKIVDYGAVSAGQQPPGGCAISTDSAPAVRREWLFPATPCTIVERGSATSTTSRRGGREGSARSQRSVWPVTNHTNPKIGANDGNLMGTVTVGEHRESIPRAVAATSRSAG